MPMWNMLDCDQKALTLEEVRFPTKEAIGTIL